MTSRKRRRFAVLAVFTCLLVLAACSGPDNDGNDSATATPTESTSVEVTTEAPAEPTATTTTEPTAEPTATTEPTATSSPTPEPTATPTTEPTATPTATATATATEPPGGGQALEIDGQPVAQVIQADPSGADLYAISNDTLYRSDDAGDSWSEVGPAAPGRMIVALNDPTMLMAGDRDTCGRGESDYPFSRSYDGGQTWEELTESSAYEPLLAFNSNQALVFGTSCGLSFSSDGGETWSRIDAFDGLDVFDLETERDVPMEQLLAVAVTEGGSGSLFLLDNADPVNPTIIATPAEFWADAVTDWRENRIVIATSTGIGVMNDDEETISWSRAGLEDATLEQDPREEGFPPEFDQPVPHWTTVRIVPDIIDLIWAGGNHGAYLSTDGGATWQPIDEEIDVSSIAISIASGRVYVSGGGETHIYTLDGQ